MSTCPARARSTASAASSTAIDNDIPSAAASSEDQAMEVPSAFTDRVLVVPTPDGLELPEEVAPAALGVHVPQHLLEHLRAEMPEATVVALGPKLGARDQVLRPMRSVRAYPCEGEVKQPSPGEHVPAVGGEPAPDVRERVCLGELERPQAHPEERVAHVRSGHVINQVMILPFSRVDHAIAPNVTLARMRDGS
eukprot:CAMPEP_0206022832 /NCGR_PEP_ID=MMETSP1464-20131121/35355_1 /ASSEMBLY_ACC=CAM_ASM_001124 /TAXON_ID=119497 /ORGANISM="Exanthemachrysis gayraliae, Strain RCC1523" /LENGTH=193 /DNA_ID=CAMNT_0053396807 /DNA_START=211 /DNA_END=791 /DNA_ORIENTATION=-